ncbi:hypothetical protein ATER59S_00533 [Aquamicrobium terrae]
MPTFTIKSTYRLPYSRKRTYEAATLEDACRLALEDADWSGQLANYECVGPTYVSRIWEGRDTAHIGDEIHVPSQFDEMAHRMILHFHELLVQLACIAQPMGLPVSEFDLWLPRATAAVEKARAIIRERPDPDEPTAENAQTAP